MICDEVINGLGRTGRLWGLGHFGVWPDILTFGKGMGVGFFPICATVLSVRSSWWAISRPRRRCRRRSSSTGESRSRCRSGLSPR